MEKKYEETLILENIENDLSYKQKIAQLEAQIDNIKLEIKEIKNSKNSNKNKILKEKFQKINKIRNNIKLLLKKEQKRKIIVKKQANKKSFNILRFESRLKKYLKKQFWNDILLVFLGSLIITIGFDYFINPTGANGIFPAGLGAIARQLSIFFSNGKNRDTYYFLIYGVLNIPLFIFGLFKVGIKFSLLTIAFLIFQNLINLVIVNLPYINPEKLNMIINFDEISKTGSGGALNKQPIYLIWLFVFAFISAIVCGAGYSLIYMGGGSSAGTDFIGAYFQKKKRISIASVNQIINIFLTVGVIFSHSLIISKTNLYNYFNVNSQNAGSITHLRIEYFFGPTLFASFLLLWLQTIVVNNLYPKFKFVKLTIYSNNPQHIREALQLKGFINCIEIQEKNIYYRDEVLYYYSINIHTSLVNYKKIKAIVKVVDPEAQISTSKIHKVIGKKIS